MRIFSHGGGIAWAKRGQSSRFPLSVECLCTALFAGRSHLVWQDASFDLMSVHKAGWKVRLMSNTYMLQAARDKFNQHEVDPFCLLCRKEPENMLRNGLLQSFGTFKMPLLMFISILVFRPEGQIWNPVRRDTRIYVRRILNASRISKTQLNSCTISPS